MTVFETDDVKRSLGVMAGVPRRREAAPLPPSLSPPVLSKEQSYAIREGEERATLGPPRPLEGRSGKNGLCLNVVTFISAGRCQQARESHI